MTEYTINDFKKELKQAKTKLRATTIHRSFMVTIRNAKMNELLKNVEEITKKHNDLTKMANKALENWKPALKSEEIEVIIPKKQQLGKPMTIEEKIETAIMFDEARRVYYEYIANVKAKMMMEEEFDSDAYDKIVDKLWKVLNKKSENFAKSEFNPDNLELSKAAREIAKEEYVGIELEKYEFKI